MSDYGIQVNRTGSKIQIDGTHQNHTVWKYGTNNKAAGRYYFTVSLYNVATSTYDLTEHPYIAVNLNDTDYNTPAKSVASIGHCRFDTTVYNAYTGASITTGTAAMSIPWMVITPPNHPRQHYGLEIFNANADSVFASWENYVELVGAHSFNLAAGGAADNNTVYVTVADAVNNYFVLMPANFKWHTAVGSNTLRYYTMGMGYRGTTTLIVHSAVQCATYNMGADTGYYYGTAWTNTGTILEFAPVKVL